MGIVTLLAALSAAIFAERAAHHTKRSADTAAAQLLASESITKKQLRAYLDFEDVSFSEWPEIDGGRNGFRGFQITIKNYGTTPFLSGKRFFQYLWQPGDGEQKVLWEHRAAVAGLAPGDIAYISDEMPLTQADWWLVRAGGASITLRLSIEYQDVFDDTHYVAVELLTRGEEPIGLVPGSKKNT